MKQFQTRDRAGFASGRGQALLALVIVCATVAAYAPALNGGFIWDDSPLVSDNPLIKAPNGLGLIWFTRKSAEYLPLTFTMQWAEWRLWGGRPAGFHVVNVLLHAASAMLLWRALRRLRVPGAWLAGMLFAVHPVAAASAAWISELKNTLSMALCAGSLLVFLRFEEEAEKKGISGEGEIGRLGRETGPASASSFPVSELPLYLGSLFLFLLALLAKTSVVMLPVILLMCAWWRRGRIGRRDLLRSAPFFALSLGLGLVTVWFQGRAIGGAAVHPESAAARLAGAGWVAWFYLFKVLLPAGLCALYPYWKVSATSWRAFVPLVLLAACLGVLWARRRTWGRAPLFALGCFLILLAPVLGFMDMSFMRFSLVADHLQYAAMAGIVALAAAGLARVWRLRGRPGVAGIAGAVVCVAVLGALTCRRAWVYADEERLWRDNAAKNPNAWAAWDTLGGKYFNMSRYEEAVPLYSEAIRSHPDLPDAFNNRAYAYILRGQYDLAIRDCDEAIKLRPEFAGAYNNRGVAYGRLNRYDRALRDYDEAIRLKPDYAEAYNNRGNADMATGRYDQALRDFGLAIQFRPGYAEAYCNRGNARVGKDLRGAVEDYTEAIRLKPDYATAYRNRAVAWFYLKEYDKSEADVQALRKLGGEADPEFIKELGRARGK